MKTNSYQATESELINKDLKMHVKKGVALLVLLFFIVVIWGGCAEISSAVISQGKVSLESSVKKIQHKEGGIISELYVREGDKVKSGQLLARIDPTVTEANLIVVRREIEELTARRLRLIAERDDLSELPKNDDYLILVQEKTLKSERRLLTERKKMRVQQATRLEQQIAAYEAQIRGFNAQLNSDEKQNQLILQEATGLRQLFEKKLISIAQRNSAERQLAQ